MNFSWSQPQQKEEKPPFQISESMTMNDLTPEIKKEFIEVYNEIKNAKKFTITQKKAEQSKESNEAKGSEEKGDDKSDANEGEDLLNKVFSTREAIVSEIFGSLTSLAHQIDAGKKIVKEYSDELKISQEDYRNSEQIRSLPSPFIIRFVDNVEKLADDLSQSISAFGSHLQPSLKPDDDMVIYNYLNEQHNAIVRCSSKVSKINEKLITVRNNLASKLKINAFSFSQSEPHTENTYAQSIQSKYQQFLAQNRNKNQKRLEESDLFGNSTVEAPKTSSFGSSFGNFSNFGNFGNSSFSTKK